MTARHPSAVVRLLRNEFAVTPARWQRMLGMTGCASLVALLLLVFRVPLTAYGPYVVLMAAQREKVTAVGLSMGALVATLAAIAVSLLFYMVDIDEPALRIPVMTLVMFAAMYLAHLPKTGPLFFLAGYILVVTQTLVDQVGDPEALTHLLLWLGVVAFSAFGTTALMEAMLGRTPAALFAEGMAECQQRMAQRLAAAPVANPTVSLREMAVQASRLGAGAVRKLAALVQLEQLAAMPQARDAHFAGVVTRLNDSLSDDPRSNHSGETPGAALPPLASPDAHLTSVRFAFKATLAAMLCYVVYSALDWNGIRTSLITCFFVAMASTGETIHKLSLRIVGALIGGFLAGFCIVFLFPWIDDIGGFLVIFAVITLFCAWVTTANPLIAYTGQQITLAFYLGMLQDTGPTDDLTVLRDRLAGILLGNIAMSLVFACLWPVSTAAHARALLARVANRQAALLQRGTVPADADIVASAVDLEEASRLDALAVFDAGASVPTTPPPELLNALRRAVVWSSAWLHDVPPAEATREPAETWRALAAALEGSKRAR